MSSLDRPLNPDYGTSAPMHWPAGKSNYNARKAQVLAEADRLMQESALERHSDPRQSARKAYEARSLRQGYTGGAW